MDNLCLTIASSVLGRSYAESIGNHLSERIKGLAGALKYDGVIDAINVENLDPCCTRIIIVATGGTENTILKIVERTSKTVLISHKHYNSLPATVEAASYLRKIGLKFTLKSAGSFDEIVEHVETYVKASRVAGLFKGARFGLIGGVSDWLVYSKIDYALLRERVGAEVVEIPVSELIQEYESIFEAKDVESVLNKALKVNVPPSEVERASRLYTALNRLINKYDLRGVSIKCFDIIKPTGTTACLALSLLNSQGFPASCEGDLPLLVSMAMGTWITGKPVFMGNPSYIEDRELVLAHCTSPLIGPFELHTHFESNKGVGIKVDFPVDTPATLYRVDSELRELRIGVGRIVSHTWSPSLCRTQVKIEMNNPLKLVQEPIGNHYALVLGDHSKELEALGDILDLRVSFF